MNRKDPMLSLAEKMNSLTPKLTFKEGLDSHTWVQKAERELSRLLGLDKFTAVDNNLQVESVFENDVYKQIKFVITVEKNNDMPCYFLLPKGKEKPPLMVCLQGHSSGAHISVGETRYEGDEESFGLERDFGLQAVKYGYAALCVEQRYFGERTMHPDESGPECHIPAMAELMMGRTAAGGRVWDVMRALDAVEQHFSDDVDLNRIGIMGNSGGGSATWYTAAMEHRIKAVMPGSSVCSYQKSIATIRHCVCNHIPHIMEWFKMGDIAGLIAPKPLIIVAGKDDPIFPIEGVHEAFEQVGKWYKMHGAYDKLRLVVGDGGHKFFPNDAWPVFKEVTGW